MQDFQPTEASLDVCLFTPHHPHKNKQIRACILIEKGKARFPSRLKQTSLNSKIKIPPGKLEDTEANIQLITYGNLQIRLRN